MDDRVNEYVNDFNKIDYDHILLSYVGKNIKPRYILGTSTYPVTLEINNCIALFGVDNAYGKLYMKISLHRNDNHLENIKNVSIFKNIDNTLSKLIQEKENAILEPNLNKNIIQTMLDRNITILDNSGNNVSVFSITKGIQIKTLQITLGDIFYVSKSQKYNYKWIVNKIVL